MALSASEKIFIALEPKVNELGYELVDTVYVKENQNIVVRVFIDFLEPREEAVGLEDCEIVSRSIGDIIDLLYDVKYFLEVSSPGLERVLKKEKDFIRFIGREAEIKLYNKLNDKKSYTGVIKNFEQNMLTLKCDTEEVEIEHDKIAKANLVFHF
ncbi:MAG: ribosome maturation factor RimP [Fusobacteria bacterium]|nr:ribosome maturation factor RimP [Fusobacteriota bacterium]